MSLTVKEILHHRARALLHLETGPGRRVAEINQPTSLRLSPALEQWPAKAATAAGPRDFS